MDPLEQQIQSLFQEIKFADTGDSILERGVVDSVSLEGTAAEVTLVIPHEYESFIGSATKAVQDALLSIAAIEEVGIRVVESADILEAEAPKQPGPAPQAPQSAQQPANYNYLQEYTNVVLVASGKGGVGKSTTAVNLAMALKAIGKTVSLFDADIYGPSIPIMMGARGAEPDVIGQQMKSMSRMGIEFMSIGALVKEEDSLIWRGPMAHQAIQQLLRDVAWPGGDYMIVDLPPGTGDVQLSFSQLTNATGALIVCTPQDVALLDAQKAITMFEKVDIPIIGVIENMSAFVCPSCGTETPIFSKGGAADKAKDGDFDFLGAIPIELDVRIGGDEGKPVVFEKPDSDVAKKYVDIAKKLDKILSED